MVATKDSGIPKSDVPTNAAESELPGGKTSVQGSEEVLHTAHPKLLPDDGKMSPEMEAFRKADEERVKAQLKADESTLTPEQKAANEAAAKADDARAKANEAAAKGAEPKNFTVADVGTLAVVDPSTRSADHFAQKFGNDPANPKLASGIKPDENLVRISRVTPDFPGKVTDQVPREMLGDYERAGWNRDVG